MFSVDCEWSAWSWESCTKSCGAGVQLGVRIISQEASGGGDDCTGSAHTSRICNTNACPGMNYI